MDRYKRPKPISAAAEIQRQQEREVYIQQHINDLWRTIPSRKQAEQALKEEIKFPADPQENILYFMEKNAPMLENWQREIIRIVRKTAQYFYPQRQTQVMNEGWATFWHYTLLNEMYDEGLVSDGFMMEFLTSHTNVVAQPDFDSRYYSGINPYALGFAMMKDIRRICENPTAEDKAWFPDIAGSNWIATLDYVMRNYRDESFILQFMSPKIMREFHFFALQDDDRANTMEVKAIHNDEGYRALRETLSQQYNLSYREPDIQVESVNLRGDRSLTLNHYMSERRPLGNDTYEMLRHIHHIWGYDVYLNSVEPDGRRTRSYRLGSS